MSYYSHNAETISNPIRACSPPLSSIVTFNVIVVDIASPRTALHCTERSAVEKCSKLYHKNLYCTVHNVYVIVYSIRQLSMIHVAAIV